MVERLIIVQAYIRSTEKRLPYMHKRRLQELSPGQRLGWYQASFVFGLCVVAAVAFSGTVSDESSRYAALIVVAVSWLAGVVLLRFYIQQVEDPTNFWSILNAGRKKE